MRIKRCGCHVDLYTVSRCHIRDESKDHTGKKAYKQISNLALKPSFEISGLTKSTCVVQSFLKKKFTQDLFVWPTIASVSCQPKQTRKSFCVITRGVLPAYHIRGYLNAPRVPLPPLPLSTATGLTKGDPLPHDSATGLTRCPPPSPWASYWSGSTPGQDLGQGLK